MINALSTENHNLKGIVKLNETLSPHTSWHIGGIADSYFKPTDIEDLSYFIQHISPTEPLTWLGLGSNVLIADTGIRGTVIHTQGTLGKIELTSIENDSQLLRVEAGVPCAKIAKWCAKHDLSGGEFFSGIPGTMGGALAMNAGAFGGETWMCVEKVEVISRAGQLLTRFPEDYDIGYRSVKLKQDLCQEWFTAAYLRFPVGDSQETQARIKALLKKRNESQPIGSFNCGSVFKNPTSHHAARLIETCGLKGYQIGDAQISTKHSNFIINLDKASATDVLKLIQLIQSTVWQKHNIQLQTEVRMLGF